MSSIAQKRKTKRKQSGFAMFRTATPKTSKSVDKPDVLLLLREASLVVWLETI